MNGKVFDIRRVNVALANLHSEAQNAEEHRLANIANNYLVIVSQEDFRRYAMMYNKEKCNSLGTEYASDLYQDTCLKISEHIRKGNLPDIQHSASAYFMRAFSNTLLSAIKKKKAGNEVVSTGSETGMDLEKSEKMISFGSKTYDLENLKNCFYLLFFIQSKLKMKNFEYYCARISFTNNELAAMAIYRDKKPWDQLEAEEKAGYVYRLKNGHKTPNKTVSNLFTNHIRQQGLINKHKYFSENAMTALNSGSLIATGIMWYFYINRESLTENFSITTDQLRFLSKKINWRGAFADRGERLQNDPFFDLEKLVLAMLAVFSGFDSRGKHYLQSLRDELNSETTVNSEFTEWLGNSLSEIVKIDYRKTYQRHEAMSER